jgi:hypothetical protein
MTQLKPYDWKNEPIDFHDYVIKGEMIIASMIMKSFHTFDMSDSERKAHIKETLAKELAHYILENKMVEFTQIKDPSDDITVKARCFLVPSSEVQLIREILKK